MEENSEINHLNIEIVQRATVNPHHTAHISLIYFFIGSAAAYHHSWCNVIPHIHGIFIITCKLQSFSVHLHNWRLLGVEKQNTIEKYSPEF